jgi:hypothetical protein
MIASGNYSDLRPDVGGNEVWQFLTGAQFHQGRSAVKRGFEKIARGAPRTGYNRRQQQLTRPIG